MIKEVKSWVELPSSGMVLHNPRFRDMELNQAYGLLNAEVEWIPYGYNEFILCRATSSFHLFKAK